MSSQGLGEPGTGEGGDQAYGEEQTSFIPFYCGVPAPTPGHAGDSIEVEDSGYATTDWTTGPTGRAERLEDQSYCAVA